MQIVQFLGVAAMGVCAVSRNEDRAVQDAVDAVKILSIKVNIPQKLSSIDALKKDFGYACQL